MTSSENARPSSVLKKVFSLIRFGSKDRHLLDVFRDTGLGFILRVGGAGLAFGANWFLARNLGPSGVGVYYLAFTTITIVAVFCRLGLNETCVRYAAPAAVSGDWRTVAGVHRTARRLVFNASLVMTIVLIALAPYISKYFFHETVLINTLRFMAFALIPFSLLNIDSAMLQSVRRVPASTFFRAAAIPGSFFLLLAGAAYFQLSPMAAAGCYSVATLLVFFGGAIFWKAAVPQADIQGASFNSRSLLRTGLRIMGVNSLSLVMTWIDTVCIGIWHPSAEVGVYGIAVRIALLTSFVVSAASAAVGPKYAAFNAEKNIAALRSLTQRSSLAMLFVVLPVSGFLVCFPSFVLGLFGKDFKSASTVLVILTIGQFVSVVTGTLGHLLMMTGNEKDLRNIIATTAIMNVVLNVILVPNYGIKGAAISTSISLVSMSLLCVWGVKRRLDIWSVPKW